MTLESAAPKGSLRDEPCQIDKFVFALSGLGLNITFAIYLAYVQIYGEAFSRTILGRMNIAIYVAATSVVLVQMYVDPFFDRVFTPKATYTFRICLALVVMFLTLLSIPFADNDVHHVYLVGVLIGLFEGSGLSTIQQLAAVVHPDLTKHVNTGFTVAQVLPIALSVALGFYNAQAGSFAAIAFAWIPAGLCLVACALQFGLVIHGNLNRAFAEMDRTLADCDPEQTPLIADIVGRGTSKESCGTQKGNVWLTTPVLLCSIVQFMTNGFSMFLMPFLTYFGAHDLAHMLVLVRFASELGGRILSHLWGYSYWNLDASQAITILVASIVFRGALLVAILSDAFGFYKLGLVWLVVLVSLFYLSFGWSQSEVMTVVVEVGPAGATAELARGMMFLCFAAQLLSLAIAVSLVEFHLEAVTLERSLFLSWIPDIF